MAVKWLKKLKDFYPDIANQAHELNNLDNFTMYKRDKKRSSGSDDEILASTSEKHKKKKIA